MKWLLWIAIGVAGLFFAVWAATPRYKLDAIQLRKACEHMIGAAAHRQRECDKIYSDAIARGQAEKR